MAVSLAAASPAGAQGTAPAPAALPPNPLGVQARAALLMDAATGQVLYAFNEDERIEPASLAKLMTFELALEALDHGVISWDTKVPVSERAWRLALDNKISNMFLEVGQQVSVRDLLYGLMVSSGNDAALALAEYLGGSEEGFVARMNERARELGLRDTVFKNSHGLYADGQYTTARDMALLARHIVLAHPEAFRITSAKEFTWNRIRQLNWNRLVLVDPRVDGLKTGHLAEAGYHLVATARDRGMELIAVLLGMAGEEARVREGRKLLDYGFRSFATVTPELAGKVPERLPVYKGRTGQVTVRPAGPVRVTVPRGREGDVRLSVSLPRYVVAPVKAGQELGRLTLSLDGKELVRVGLQAGEGVPRGGLWRVVWDSLRLFFRNLFRR